MKSTVAMLPWCRELITQSGQSFRIFDPKTWVQNLVIAVKARAKLPDLTKVAKLKVPAGAFYLSSWHKLLFKS